MAINLKPKDLVQDNIVSEEEGAGMKPLLHIGRTFRLLLQDNFEAATLGGLRRLNVASLT